MKPYYDELYDSKGEIRDRYVPFHNVWLSISKAKKRKLATKTKDLFSGDYELDLLPRVITDNEIKFLRKGVEQRAKAIRSFLFDYLSGKNRWKKIIPPKIMKAIALRYERCLEPMNPKHLAFSYGPDLIRDKDGNWRVLEDSAGILGGIGDLEASHRILLNLIPQYRKFVSKASDPAVYYARLAEHYRWQAKSLNGMPLVIFPSFLLENDHETKRLAKILSSLGILVWDGEAKFTFRNKKVFFRKGNKSHRISYLILRFSPQDIGNLGITIKPGRYVKEKIVIHLPSPIDSVIPLIEKGQIRTNYASDIPFINDKMFGIFVDAMIQYYLKEAPIIPSVPARPVKRLSASENCLIDSKFLKKVSDDRYCYVIKHVKKDCGEGVWIGKKMSALNFERILRKVRQSPDDYIIQEFQHPSVLGERIVDMRLHAHVDTKKIVVSNVPWGRANWKNGNGKVNIGAGGIVSPVVITKEDRKE